MCLVCDLGDRDTKVAPHWARTMSHDLKTKWCHRGLYVLYRCSTLYLNTLRPSKENLKNPWRSLASVQTTTLTFETAAASVWEQIWRHKNKEILRIVPNAPHPLLTPQEIHTMSRHIQKKFTHDMQVDLLINRHTNIFKAVHHNT